MRTEARERGHQWFDAVLRRPGLVIGCALALGAAGLGAFVSLPRDLFPPLALSTIQILIQSPGREATELESTVAQPVEQAVQGIPGVRRVTSTVQPGVVQVVVSFERSVDGFESRMLVAERLSQLAGDLPVGTGAALLTSAAGRLQEIQELVLEGPTVDPMELRDAALQTVVPRLRSVPGVARVELLGGGERQLAITLSPERLRLAGASMAQVLEALEGSERDAGVGILEVTDKVSFVTVGSLAAEPESVRRLAVHTAHGLVPLGDLAEIREAPGFRMGLARFQGFEAVSLRVVKQPTAETLATARAVRALIPEIQAGLPDGMHLRLFYDQGELVAHALGGVGTALGIGSLFVALVLVLLLGNARGALIVVGLLPLALLGSALILGPVGLGLNAMTLGGLAIAVGLLVDAGVIMIENIVHRLARAPGSGLARREVVARAAAEVTVPIATAVVVVMATFLPLLAVGGVAGALYTPLSVAVAAAMGLSLVLSLTLVPVLAERLLGADAQLREPRSIRLLKALYQPVLERSLARTRTVQLAALVVAVPAVMLALRLGTNFLPTLHEGAVMVQTLLPSDASLAAVDEANLQLERELATIDGVAASYRRTGRGEITEDPMPHYLSDVLVVLEPGASAEAVGRELEELGEALPFQLELTTPMGMRIAEGIGGTPADIQVELFHPDLALLAASADEVEQRLANVSGVASVTADTGAPLPRWRVIPDDEALRRLDVPRSLIETTVAASLQGLMLPPRWDGPQRIDRIVRFPSDGRVTATSLARLPMVVEEGRIVDLGQVVHFEESPSPAMIRRKNGQRRLGFNVRTEGDLGGTARRIETAMAEVELPAGTAVALSGKVEETRASQRRLWAASVGALTLVVLLVYLALGTGREVAIVVATLPVAFAGGLYALVLAGESWNVSSIVGVIGLFGVAIQNSLVLISQTQHGVAGGLPFGQALREAAVGRLRPKLMTAGASILGLLPMLFGFGGSELERPLAIVMIGGLVTSTFFTLVVLPAAYAHWCERR